MSRGLSKRLKPVRDYVANNWQDQSDIMLASEFEGINTLTIRRIRYSLGLIRTPEQSEELKCQTLNRRKNFL